MIGNILQADLEEIIKSKNWDELRDALSELPPVDIAEVLIDLPVEDEGVIFRVLPRKLAALVFSYLPLDRQEELLHCFSNEQVRNILDQMTPDDRTRLLEETPAEVTRRLLDTLSPDELKATASKSEVLAAFERYDRVALPVTDAVGHMLGIITVDDVLDVAEQKATEEMQKMGGMEALDAPYMDVGFWPMVKKRGGWLSALFLGEMLTATAMGVFEKEIERAAVVALFVPLIISSGGNSGSQATSLMIRSLALKELKLSDWWAVFHKEVTSGAVLGAFLGCIGFVRIMLWHYLGWANYHGHPYLMGVTVWASLVGVVLFGSVVGSMLPFVLRRLGLDPATSSAPFVATLVDVTGLVIYFSVAFVFLKGTLL